jgi:hypothetical protein
MAQGRAIRSRPPTRPHYLRECPQPTRSTRTSRNNNQAKPTTRTGRDAPPSLCLISTKEREMTSSVSRQEKLRGRGPHLKDHLHDGGGLVRGALYQIALFLVIQGLQQSLHQVPTPLPRTQQAAPPDSQAAPPDSTRRDPRLNTPLRRTQHAAPPHSNMTLPLIHRAAPPDSICHSPRHSLQRREGQLSM